MKTMPGDSFEFRGVNFREKFDIRVVKIDFILPPKRARKTQIPKRHGMYDHGAINWDERRIRIDADLLRPLTRAELREVSALLSKKGHLYLWDEPDKYYVGEIYQTPEIFEYPKANIRVFTLEFQCEPFAYREAQVLDIVNGYNPITYDGTVEAPVLITLENKGATTIENITIDAVYRRG